MGKKGSNGRINRELTKLRRLSQKRERKKQLISKARDLNSARATHFLLDLFAVFCIITA